MARSNPPVVLVTGVGAIIGQGIVRSLRAGTRHVRIVGLDRSDRPPGSTWCDDFVLKPTCDEDSEEYLDFWESLLRDHHVDIVLPGLEVDVCFLDRNRSLQAVRADCVFALNHSDLIATSNDKWRTHSALVERGIPTIPTVIGAEWDEALRLLGAPPILLKPRSSSGSRGIVRLHDREDLDYWSHKTGQEWVLQRIVGSDDQEYTVGSFGFGDGTAVEPIIMRRRLSRAGHTIEAEVVEHPLLRERVDNLTAAFSPLGPTNYQFRVENSHTYLLEINPRFSSSTSLRTCFGYNEAQMAIDYFLFGTKPTTPEIRHGRAWRFTEDHVVHDSDPV